MNAIIFFWEIVLVKESTTNLRKKTGMTTIPAWKLACFNAHSLENRIRWRPTLKNGTANPHLSRTRQRIEGAYTHAIGLYPNRKQRKQTKQHGDDLHTEIKTWTIKTKDAYLSRFPKKSAYWPSPWRIVYSQLINYCIALAPFMLPDYAVLWILDWVPLFSDIAEFKKIALISSLSAAFLRVNDRRIH